MDNNKTKNYKYLLKKLKEKHVEIFDKIAIESAKGNLSDLSNSRSFYKTGLIELYDSFFDNEELQLKYNTTNMDVSSEEIEKILDITDLKKWYNYFKKDVEMLEEELRNIKSEEEEFLK